MILFLGYQTRQYWQFQTISFSNSYPKRVDFCQLNNFEESSYYLDCLSYYSSLQLFLIMYNNTATTLNVIVSICTLLYIIRIACVSFLSHCDHNTNICNHCNYLQFFCMLDITVWISTTQI
jgi:hypothetical protein